MKITDAAIIGVLAGATVATACNQLDLAQAEHNSESTPGVQLDIRYVELTEPAPIESVAYSYNEHGPLLRLDLGTPSEFVTFYSGVGRCQPYEVFDGSWAQWLTEMKLEEVSLRVEFERWDISNCITGFLVE